jgi:acetolactate synthase-1/2/3 large subunit
VTDVRAAAEDNAAERTADDPAATPVVGVPVMPDLAAPAPEAAAAPEAAPAPEATAAPPAPAASDVAAPTADTFAEPATLSAAAPAPVAPAPEAVVPPQPPVPARTAGRFVADALHSAGVRVAFTVPGESFLGLLEALGPAGIRVVATRHEGGAAFMAEAYGQLTGRPAAALGTRAVGAANLAIGIHTAKADSTPMFALLGQVPRVVRGREGFQEVDLAGSIGRLATHAAEVDDPARLPAAMAEATRQALGGRPGPVLLAFPEDVLDEQMPDGAEVAHVVRSRPADPDPDVVRTAIRRLSAGRRPLIIAGAGVLRARSTADLVRLAEILEVPVVGSWRRADVFPNGHPLYLGMTGYAAPDSLRARMADADELLVIGCRLNEPTSMDYAIPSDDQRWTHVDIEPRVARAGLRAPDLAIQADARTFLRVAARLLAGAVHDKDALDARRAANLADRAAWEAATVVDGGDWEGPGVHPGRIIATMARVLPPEAIVATDAGNFAGWLARGYRFQRPGTFLGPTSGAMGYALPAAIAAALVHHERPVIGVTGDGGFGMTMAELETAVRERCRIVLIVFDNRRYGTIRMHQAARGTGVGVATELGPLDIVRIAEGFGARGVRAEDDEAFETALRDALVADGPTVIHLPLDRRWVSIDDHPGKVDAAPAATSDETDAPRDDSAGAEPASSVAAPTLTYHLMPAEVWEAAPDDADYEPASLATEGFVHCTDGVDGLRASGDRHYRDDPRPFLVATIDLDRLAGAWHYDDADRRFPHIYRSIPRVAVVRVVPAPRAEDGSFLDFPA